MNGLSRFAGLLGLVVLIGIAFVDVVRPELVRADRGYGSPALDATPIISAGLALILVRLIYLVARGDRTAVRALALAGIVVIGVVALGSVLLLTMGPAASSAHGLAVVGERGVEPPRRSRDTGS